MDLATAMGIVHGNRSRHRNMCSNGNGNDFRNVNTNIADMDTTASKGVGSPMANLFKIKSDAKSGKENDTTDESMSQPQSHAPANTLMTSSNTNTNAGGGDLTEEQVLDYIKKHGLTEGIKNAFLDSQMNRTTSSRKKDTIKEKTANRTLVSALTNFNLDDHGFNLDNLTFEHDSDSDDDIFSGYVPGLEPLPLAAPSGTAESMHNLHQPLSLGLGGVPVAGSYASASLAAAVPTGSCMYQHQYQQSSFQQTQEHSFNTSASVASTAGRNSHSGMANKIKVGNKQDDKTEENKEPAVKLNLDKLLFSAEYAIARAREMNNKGNTRAPGGAANKSKALKERVKAEKDARREKMEKEAKEKTEAALKGDGIVELQQQLAESPSAAGPTLKAESPSAADAAMSGREGRSCTPNGGEIDLRLHFCVCICNCVHVILTPVYPYAYLTIITHVKLAL